MKKTPAIFIFVALLALSGWGCSRSTATPKPVTATPPNSVSGQTQPVHIPTEADFRNELREAVKNFNAAKSFRAKVNLAAGGGELNAVLEFAKPNRFRGTIQGSDGSSTEIVVVDDSLYMRVNNLKWLNLSKTPSASSIAGTLKSALSGDTNLANVAMDESFPVQKTKDLAHSCDLYSTSIKQTNGSVNKVSVCLSRGRPQYLDLVAAQGPIHIDYYDYNAVFLIERPI